MAEALGEARERSMGLLPPAKNGLGEIDPVAMHAKRSAMGACPFFGKPPPGQQVQATSSASSGSGAGGYSPPPPPKPQVQPAASTGSYVAPSPVQKPQPQVIVSPPVTY
jgi:hypothetical protein